MHRQRGTPVRDYEGHAVACDTKDDGPPAKTRLSNETRRCHRSESETGRSHGWKLHLLSIQNDDTLPSRPEIESDSGVSSRRRQLAAAVAEHIRVTLANLGLRESLRLEAVRDALTGLDNGRYMQEFLDHQLHSARRKHRPLAVLMFDLDHFKQYNDKFGHSAGDKVKAVGETLMRSVCAEDVACRYGGEEFVLILPECSLRQATVRAEEVRQRLQELHSDQDIPPTNSLTASIGVAAFDETTDRVDRLLKFRRRSSLPSQVYRPKPRRRGSPRGRFVGVEFQRHRSPPDRLDFPRLTRYHRLGNDWAFSSSSSPVLIDLCPP